MKQFTAMLSTIDGYVWGIPMLVLIIGTGLLLTVRTGALQFCKLGKALKYMVHNEEGGEGEVSSFAALTTALAATVGTGNIVGVATAICTGGPGALFWMEVAACVGMATKYSEGLLAVKYRVLDENGKALGGPFYYIERGLGPNWKWLAKLFAFFGAAAGILGIGTITQVNSITSAVGRVFDPEGKHIAFSIGDHSYTWTTTIAAIVVTALVALVVIGGIQRISSVASLVVPAMMVLYVTAAVAILVYNYAAIPAAIATIVKSAFGMDAVAGGALGAMIAAMQKGVARGIFSNESGLGSAPIAAAAAQTKEPVRQGLVSMTGTFLDTIVICTLTALTIIISGVDVTFGVKPGSALITAAFGTVFNGTFSSVFIAVALTLFAYSTILGWSLYGSRCVQYLLGLRAAKVYQFVFIIMIVVGSVSSLDFVWNIADTLNGLMAIPNFIALFALSPVIFKITREYFRGVDLASAKHE